MRLTPNPYEPPTRAIDNRPWKQCFVDWLWTPFPIRAGTENPFRWLVDAFVAFVLWVVGTLIAGVFAGLTSVLDPIAYPVALFVGWFPIAMWMDYCRVSNDNGHGLGAILLIAILLPAFAIVNGWSGVMALPLAFAILMLVLPLELLFGKLVLGWLPSSSTKKRTEP